MFLHEVMMRGFVMTVRDDDLKNLVGSLWTHKVVWCLLLMEASPWLLTQVLHLQKQTGHCSLNNCGRAATTCVESSAIFAFIYWMEAPCFYPD